MDVVIRLRYDEVTRMTFYFPKDEELFNDLENIGERSEDLAEMNQLLLSAEMAEERATRDFRDKSDDMFEEIFGGENETREKPA